MSGSYWKVGDKVNIGQSDIEIRALGSNEFEENQVIGIYIPPSIKFFQGNQCYLNFDLLVKYDPTTDGLTSTDAKLTLDGTIGANSLFSRVVCYAGNRQKVLESTDQYSSMVNIKYSYEQNDSIRNKRALTELCGTWNPQNRGTCGSFKSHQNNVQYNALNQQGLVGKNADSDPNGIGSVAPADVLGYTKARVSLQIHMGMFANSKSAFPNLLTNGAFIELTCSPNKEVFRTFDSTSLNRKVSLNPIFASTDGANTRWTNGVATDEFYTEQDNGQTNPAHSPFAVGESIGFYKRTNGTEPTMDVPAIISKIESGVAGQPIKYTLADPVTLNTDLLATHNREWMLYSKAIGADFNAKYLISDVKLVVRQLSMGDKYEQGIVSKMKNGGMIQFDLPSINCQLHSALAGDLQQSIPISCEHAKARSIIVMPCDSKPYTQQQATDSGGTYEINKIQPNSLSAVYGISEFSDRPYITGIGDYLTSYQFQIDGKLVPSRRIETDLSSSKGAGINQNHLIELEKALQQSHNMKPLSFVNYQRNFLIGRALTLDENTIFDGRNKDTRLNLRYEGTAPDKDKLFKIFVSHLKTISIKGDDIMVEN